jgi:hypothetical protein
MKKILLSAVAICAAAAAGGYYLAVEKFATEAEYFKESLATSEVFKTKAISIDKHKFQIVLDGVSINLEKPLSLLQLNEEEGEVKLDGIQLDIHAPLKLQYTPIFNKLTLLTPATHYEITGLIADKPLTIEVEGDTGTTVFNLSHIPSLKDKSLYDFMVEYADKISFSSGHYTWKNKGAERLLGSIDQSHILLTSEKSAAGKKVTYDYDTKGIQVDMGEIFKFIASLMPKEPNVPNLSNFYAPITGFTDAKRDIKGQVSFDGDISQIIASLKTIRASQGQVGDLFQSFKGSTVEATSEDLMLGSKLNTEIKLKLPKAGEDTDAELKYRVDGEVSPQLQAVWPKAIFQRFKSIKSDIDLTEEAFHALTPNLAALGKIVMDLDAKGNFEKKLGTAKVEVSTTDYGVYANANVGQDNMVINVKVKNYDALLRELQTYLQKIVDHPEMVKNFTPEQKAQIPTYSELAKATLKSMGKEEIIDGKPSIVIEQTIPTALLGLMGGGVPTASTKRNN